MQRLDYPTARNLQQKTRAKTPRPLSLAINAPVPKRRAERPLSIREISYELRRAVVRAQISANKRSRRELPIWEQPHAVRRVYSHHQAELELLVLGGEEASMESKIASAVQRIMETEISRYNLWQAAQSLRAYRQFSSRAQRSNYYPQSKCFIYTKEEWLRLLGACAPDLQFEQLAMQVFEELHVEYELAGEMNVYQDTLKQPTHTDFIEHLILWGGCGSGRAPDKTGNGSGKRQDQTVNRYATKKKDKANSGIKSDHALDVIDQFDFESSSHPFFTGSTAKYSTECLENIKFVSHAASTGPYSYTNAYPTSPTRVGESLVDDSLIRGIAHVTLEAAPQSVPVYPSNRYEISSNKHGVLRQKENSGANATGLDSGTDKYRDAGYHKISESCELRTSPTITRDQYPSPAATPLTTRASRTSKIDTTSFSLSEYPAAQNEYYPRSPSPTPLYRPRLTNSISQTQPNHSSVPLDQWKVSSGLFNLLCNKRVGRQGLKMAQQMAPYLEYCLAQNKIAQAECVVDYIGKTFKGA